MIEAAFIAADIAPGLLRDYWGFLGWRQHHAPLWQNLHAEAEARRLEGLKGLPDIRGYDRSPTAVRVALVNLEQAGLHGQIHIEKRDVADCAPQADSAAGLVVVNPPYGERIGDEDLAGLYASLGQTLQQRFLGWRAVFTGNPDLIRHFGLRAQRSHSLYNGPIPCKLLHYEISPDWFADQRRGPRPLPPERRSDNAAAVVRWEVPMKKIKMKK